MKAIAPPLLHAAEPVDVPRSSGIRQVVPSERVQMKAIAPPLLHAAEPVDVPRSSGIRQVVPSERVRYLAEITYTLRNYYAQTDPTIWILRAWSSTRMGVVPFER
jgi:hypothetical protein